MLDKDSLDYKNIMADILKSRKLRLSKRAAEEEKEILELKARIKIEAVRI